MTLKGSKNRVIKVFDNKEFDQTTGASFSRVNLDAFQEPAPSDVAYNFGSKAAAGLGVKVATYMASALALGGSLFVSNQLMTPAHIQTADQANAAGQPANVNSGSEDTSNANASGQEDSAAAATLTNNGSASSAQTAAAAAAAGNTTSGSSFGVTSHGAKRFASKTTATPTPSQTAAPSPSATQSNTVAVPAPTFSHTNTSSATPSANSASGSGTSIGGGESDDQGESGDD